MHCTILYSTVRYCTELLCPVQVVKEVLRLYPTGGQMFRQASEDTTVGGVRVPKGAGVLIMTMMLHRNPNNFHDPGTPRVYQQESCRTMPLHQRHAAGVAPEMG